MSQTLEAIAQQREASEKKAQLIYAFNGSGKTRLSRELKERVSPETEEDPTKILYYNAFTEDLFFWDNDSSIPRIQPNDFTTLVLQDLGQDQNAMAHFQRCTNEKLTPEFDHTRIDPTDRDEGYSVDPFTGVKFSYQRGNEEPERSIKISKGEESNFIWSVFYSIIEQAVFILNEPEAENRETDKFDHLEYVFIDDPVSSLDDNHLIELAVNIAELIKSSESDLKFIITTHSPLFYNVLYNELGLKKNGKKEGCYLLESLEDGTFDLDIKYGDSNQSFSYHLYLKQTIKDAIDTNQVERYHFTLLRNLYEKTASFLGYPRWSELLPDDNREAYYNRVIQFTNHNTLSNETVAQPSSPEKNTLGILFNHLINNYSYWREGEPS